MSMSNFVSTNDKMKSVKAACDKAPAGAKKDEALTHYQAAEKAHTAHKDADCLKSLEAATAALA
jgi:phage regulator Rha-like protein